MKAMKNTILFVMALMALVSLNAQEPVNTPKLDSVVGSIDFDWTRFKEVFDYTYYADGVIQDDYYVLENGKWKQSRQTLYSYDTENYNKLLGVIHLNATEDGLERASLTQYEYDDLDRLTLVMNYIPGEEVWAENSKYEYSYNAEGLIDTCVYFTKRNNGTWNEAERQFYSYDENQQCTGLSSQRKGGWGPFANQWMDSYRYEFEYENGALARELYYVPAGWFGSDMSLESICEYEFDENGNLLRKTASITNDQKDWIVRDKYENSYDASVDVTKVLGLEQFWQSMLKTGMGYASGAPMPLNSRWKTCSIISPDIDTEFTLYYSGFEGVEENQELPLMAYSHNGRLVVVNDQPADITVFDLMGRVVASETQTQQCEFNLTPGLYIVGNGKAKMKVIVK